MIHLLAILMPPIAVAVTGRWGALLRNMALGVVLLIVGGSLSVVFPPALLIAWAVWAIHAIGVIRAQRRAQEQEALASAIWAEQRRRENSEK